MTVEDRGVEIIPGGAAPDLHALTQLQEKVLAGAGVATVSCRCGRWSRQTGSYVTPLVARRMALRLHRLHAAKAARGILTVTDSLTGPEMVAAPDDERAFLREVAALVGTGPPHVLPPLLPEERWVPGAMPARSELELHPATIEDLERYGELVPA